MPEILRILETAIYVADLRVAREFYEDILGLPVIKADDRLCAYDVSGKSVLLLFARGATVEGAVDGGNEIPPHDAQGRIHFAFETTHSGLEDWVRHLEANDVTILSRTSWMRGGSSIYFRDPDDNLLEMAASPGLWPGH